MMLLSGVVSRQTRYLPKLAEVTYLEQVAPMCVSVFFHFIVGKPLLFIYS